MISSLFVIPWSGREPLGLTRKPQAPVLLLHEFIGDADNGLVRLLGDAPELRQSPGDVALANASPIVLYGPAGCGKTHLSWLLAANVGANASVGANANDGARFGGDSPSSSAASSSAAGSLAAGSSAASSSATSNQDSRGPAGRANPVRCGCWIAGAEFVKQVSAAIEADAIADLRQRLQAAPAIFLDGLERIATRASAQDELRWLLDDCRQRSVPLLVTANVLPLEIPALSPQIASRLHAGLVVPLGPPGAAARQQLFRELLAKAGLDLPPRLVSRMEKRLVPDGVGGSDHVPERGPERGSERGSERVPDRDDGHCVVSGPSVLAPLGGRRERRGSAIPLSPSVPALQEMVSELSRIFLVQQLAAGRRAARESVEPDELATRALRCVEEFVDKWSRQNVVSLKQVSQAVAEYFGIRPVELKGPSRRQMVLRARGVAIYLGRHLAGESLDRLGAHFGGRDHSTALHAVRKTEELLAEDPILRKAVDDLERRLRSDGEP